MSVLANRPFLKMNGIGNKIVVLDLRGTDATVSAGDARAIGRSPELAYDQLMVVYDPQLPETDARMEIFNIDGSLSGACGNGTRCVAWALMRGGGGHRLVLESAAGVLECRRIGEWRFSVDMGEPKFGWRDIPLAHDPGDTCNIALPDTRPAARDLPAFCAVNMGNPHAVFFVPDPDAFDLAATGSAVENHPLFPERVNTSLAHIDAPDRITLKVWERGAGATLACGSAACATLVAAVKRGLTGRAATIALPGGELAIEWRATDSRVVMTGDVELEFEGKFDPAIFGNAPA
ncbi:MAG: diaminopimelate epimerase [Beijerinckiaceae bacterium]